MVAKALILFSLVALALADEVLIKDDVKKQVEEAPVVEQKKDEVMVEDKKHKRGLLDLGFGYAAPYAYSNLAIPTVYTQGVHTNTVITKEVPVAVPHPVAVPVERHVPYPVIQKVAVPVDRPVPVHIPRPYPVEITKHVPVPYDRPVAVPYPVVKHVAVPYSQPIVVEKINQVLPAISTYTTL